MISELEGCCGNGSMWSPVTAYCALPDHTSVDAPVKQHMVKTVDECTANEREYKFSVSLRVFRV